MERNTVIIDLEKYEELIKQVENLKNDLSKAYADYMKLKLERENIDSNILAKIYKNSSWELSQTIDNDNDTYYRKQINNEFYEWGYNNEEYINEQVDIMVERYKKEHEIRMEDR